MTNNDTNSETNGWIDRVAQTAPISLNDLVRRFPPGKSLTAEDLSWLASLSPAAQYVRTLSTDAARTSTCSVLATAAAVLSPSAIPAPCGSGRKGNAAARFASACRLPWHAVTTERLGELRSELLRRKLSTNTINRTLASVRGVLEQCWRAGLMDVEALERAKACTESVRGETVPKGRHLSRTELQALVTACEQDPSPAGVRDALIIALLAAGLRRNEVADVQLQDIDLKAASLVVRGKGNKERIIFVVGGGRVALDAWLQLRGNAPGSLFFAINKSGVVHAGSSLSSQSVYKALLKRAEEAKVEVKPHDLRRTLIGEAFTAGVDVATIQRIVGHASPATTSRYDRRNEEVKRAALGLLSIDFQTHRKGGA